MKRTHSEATSSSSSSSSSSTSTTTTSSSPSVTTDARFLAARALLATPTLSSVERSIQIFATLLESVSSKHGDDSVEFASVAFEYGRALYWASFTRQQESETTPDTSAKPNTSAKSDGTLEEYTTLVSGMKIKAMKALIADRGGSTANMVEKDEIVQAALALYIDKDFSPPAPLPAAPPDTETNDEEDLGLAEEQMERAWAIYSSFEDTRSSSTTTTTSTTTTSSPPQHYAAFALAQLPRVLSSLGDLHIHTSSFASAAAAFLHALPYREKACNQLGSPLEKVKASRLLADTLFCITDALFSSQSFDEQLATPDGAVLADKGELLDTALGYYEKAREALQQTIMQFGRMAGKLGGVSEAVLRETKEDIAHVSALIIDLGNRIGDHEQKSTEK